MSEHDSQHIHDETRQDAQPHTHNHDEIDPSPESRRNPVGQAGETIVSMAAEAAYAAAGVAGIIGDKAKAFYEEQSRQYRQAHPEQDGEGGRAFLNQMAEHLNKMVDDISRSIKDLAERGRATLKQTERDTAADGSPHAEAETPIPEVPETEQH